MNIGMILKSYVEEETNLFNPQILVILEAKKTFRDYNNLFEIDESYLDMKTENVFADKWYN
jgi:hypothetical protein